MSSGVLSTRLTELRTAGLATSGPDSAWRLTPLGDDLVTALQPLLAWSHAWAEHRTAGPEAASTPATESTNSPPQNRS